MTPGRFGPLPQNIRSSTKNVGTTNADLAPLCGQTFTVRALLDYADDPNSGVFTTEDTHVTVACH